MTSEQLQSARAERWRQISNPIVTADDARAWIDGIGFCLFQSRKSQGAAFGPAPSFVEAVAGAVSDAPSRDTVENATALLHRLTSDSTVVPLNLFAVAGGSASDQPDFLVTREALPYVFSLIGGRNWKSGPGAKATPLMTEIWTLLNDGDARTAAAIQTALGREVTEGAVLRGLVELWHGLRAIPVYDGDETRWELTQARFAAEMTASQKVAQTTALSALVSLYLDAAVAASSDEIETFLSPLAARSRVREVVNGLLATRQLGLISVGAQPLLHVAGSLPEFAEEQPVAAETASRKFEKPRERGTERRPFESGERKPFESGERKPFERRERPQRFDRRERSSDRGRVGPRTERPSREGRERSGPPGERRGFGRPGGERFAARGERPFRQKSEGEHPGRRPGDREAREGGRKSFEKKTFERGARSPRPFDKERGGTGGERRSFGGGKFGPKKFGMRPSGDRPWKDRGEAGRAEGERPARREGRESFRPQSDEGGRNRPTRSDRPRPYAAGPDRAAGERSGTFGERGKTGERGGGKFGREKKFGGPKKFGAAKKFGGPKKFGKPGFGTRKGSGPRPGGAERPSFSGGFNREAPGGKRPFFRERPQKSADGEERPRRFRSEGGEPRKTSGGWKPKSAGGFSRAGKPGLKSSGKPGFKSGGKPGFKKAGSGSAGRPFGKSGKPGFGGKKFGGKKTGGFKPPFRKRKDEE